MHGVYFRRLASKSRSRARSGFGRPPSAVYGPSQTWASPDPQVYQGGNNCLRAVWFLIGGVAVVCWTEKLGANTHNCLSWEAGEFDKLRQKKMDHLQHIASCHGAQWAAMHKYRDSSNQEKK
ncbi:hypothetical protein RSOLAG1IB_05686 [Rhizoctonia solani AG-1 IB]|uniref:Uncharacterized protein n=1 Tax=Thanatephorus cucumeris (strain AG1-IB / isolate 7/3/14) TaxID=1108050 RepID=A0A0B7G128_THACB|nr:hypothetical protein RSOLAG1IB_05686 [Rhizoctonia solani AG-1 IB]